MVQMEIPRARQEMLQMDVPTRQAMVQMEAPRTRQEMVEMEVPRTRQEMVQMPADVADEERLVFCPHEGCGMQLRAKYLESHQHQCPYQAPPAIGCQQPVRAEQMDLHQ